MSGRARRAICPWGQWHTAAINADGRMRKHKRYDPLRWRMRECEGSGEKASVLDIDVSDSAKPGGVS